MRTKAERRHPEQEHDEVFLTNATTLDHIGWDTARMGRQAYDIRGIPISSHAGLYPVFVKRRELAASGIFPDQE